MAYCLSFVANKSDSLTVTRTKQDQHYTVNTFKKNLFQKLHKKYLTLLSNTETQPLD